MYFTGYFRKLYAESRKQTNQNTGMPLSEYTVEGFHTCLCEILSDAMEGGFLNHNPAWRTYKYSGKKKEKLAADEETVQKIITAPEKLNVYSFYHSNASLLIENGAEAATVAGLPGHPQPSTTLDSCTHAFDRDKKAASKALQRGLDI